MRFLPLSLILIFSCAKDDNNSADNVCLTGGYYISSSEGDDNNTGTTSCAPWKTLDRVANSTFSQDSTIYFKSGDTWYEGLNLSNSNINLSSYGDGDPPVFDGSDQIDSWASLGSDLYSFEASLTSSEGLGNLSRNSTMLFFIEWDTDVTTTFTGTSNNSFTYNGNILYIKSNTDPSIDEFRYSKIYKGLSADGISNVSINGINFTRFSLHGVEFKNCTNCDISNSTIDKIGGASLGAVYAGNGIEYGSTASDGDVDNVIISEIFDSCLSPQTYSSNQTISNISFKNSTLSQCGFAGIEVSVLSNGGTTNSSINNISMDNISISNTGNGWSGRRYGTEGHGIRVQADDGAGSISGTTISRVIINNATGDGIKISGDTSTTTIHRSQIKNGDIYGINFSDGSKTTPKLILSSSLIHDNSNYGILFNCPNCQGLNIFHNTFYNNTTINLAIFGQDNEALIKNNLFYSESPMTHLFANSSLTGGDLNHNCYNDGTNMFGYNGSAYSTVSSFNSATTFEANGVGDETVGLIDPSQENFRLDSNSGCKILGVNDTGIDLDFNGNSFLNPPSSGALQF